MINQTRKNETKKQGRHKQKTHTRGEIRNISKETNITVKQEETKNTQATNKGNTEQKREQK